MRILQVTSGPHLSSIKELFQEYVAYLQSDLAFQGFQEELDALPGKYAPPDGCLLLAVEDERAAGCVALRRISGDICEMKRMFVRPEFRGLKLGRTLADEIIREAVRLGYRRMRLDTLTTLREAVGLYRRLGFYEIEPYCYNPLPGALYMELVLKP